MVKPRKEYFKEPIIRVNTTRIRCPAICPVCGSNATKTMRISAVPGRKQWLRPEWDHDWSDTRRFGNSLSQGQTFIVPVCEDHYYGDESKCRLRLLCVVADGILMAMSFLAVASIGSDFWLGQTNASWAYPVLSFFAVAIALSYFAFKPDPFESGFRIIGFDAGMQHIWLQLKNHEYRDAFLNENPTSSELVNWIVR